MFQTDHFGIFGLVSPYLWFQTVSEASTFTVWSGFHTTVLIGIAGIEGHLGHQPFFESFKKTSIVLQLSLEKVVIKMLSKVLKKDGLQRSSFMGQVLRLTWIGDVVFSLVGQWFLCQIFILLIPHRSPCSEHLSSQIDCNKGILGIVKRNTSQIGSTLHLVAVTTKIGLHVWKQHKWDLPLTYSNSYRLRFLHVFKSLRNP